MSRRSRTWYRPALVLYRRRPCGWRCYHMAPWPLPKNRRRSTKSIRAGGRARDWGGSFLLIAQRRAPCSHRRAPRRRTRPRRGRGSACKGCVLCRSLSVTVLGRVCGRRRRRPRRGSLEVACVRVAVTAYSRVDGVWCHTYAIAATRHTLSSRRGGRHRREIRRDNGIHGTPGRHRAAHAVRGSSSEGGGGTSRDRSLRVRGAPRARRRCPRGRHRFAGLPLAAAQERAFSRRPGPPGRPTLAP